MIALHHLSKRYGAVQALKPTSLVLPAGSRTVLQGPSGSGKTTLLRLIAGLERPSTGEIHLGGDLAGNPAWLQPPHSRDIGFVFQNPALWPHLTVAQNVAFGLLGRPKREIAQRVGDILATMELDGLEKRYPSQISGGEARRTAIARTLVTRPRRLLLDEPFGALDALTRERLNLELLQVWEASRKTVVMVTHDIREAVLLSDRVLVISQRPGRVAAMVPITLPRPRSPSMVYGEVCSSLAREIREAIR